MTTAVEMSRLRERSPQLIEEMMKCGENSKAFVKVLTDYVSIRTNKQLINPSGSSGVVSEDDFKRIAPDIIEFFIMAISKGIDEVTDTYTTGQLSNIFGVSITTINNWITSGRIEGVVKNKTFKQARIPDDAVWLSPDGRRIPIAEVVRLRNNSQKQHRYNQDIEKESIRSQIAYFEDKYQGTFETVFKDKPRKTDEEQRDASEWQYLLRRVGNQ